VRDQSVVLSAGAGCGKTFVLTRRFLSHLERSGPFAQRETGLENLVAITFTERAAREMRERIREQCRERVMRAPPGEVGHWLSVLRSLETARVGTIHSFCGTLLRSHAAEAGLDPHFTILEPVQANVLLQEETVELLRELLVAEHPAVQELVHAYGLGPLQVMLSMFVENRHDYAFHEFRKETPEAIVARWRAFLRAEVWPRRLRRLARQPETQRVLSLLREHVPRKGPMLERRLTLLDLLPRLMEPALDAAGPEPLLEEILAAARVSPGGTKTAWPEETPYEDVSDALKRLRDRVSPLLKKFVWNEVQARQAAELGLHLLTVTELVAKSYDHKKRELRALDFADLIAGARDLLRGESRKDLRQKLAHGLKLLLMDEFQDTDPTQAELARLLCDEVIHDGKLFLVGDQKQSIYRFRGADPRVFQQLRSELPAPGRLPLTLNFRSQPAILHFVNHLFREALSGADGYEALRAQHPQTTAEPAVEFLWARQADDTEEDHEKRELAPSQRKREGRWIARRIRGWLEDREPRVRDRAAPDGRRAVRPGDVAILFRALSDLESYESALREFGIDYYVVGGHAFYAQQEVYDLVNVLTAAARPDDLVSLAGALRSPFFNLSDEALYWLARAPGGLAAALSAAELPAELPASDREPVRFAAQVLAELRAGKDALPIAGLIRLVLERTGYDAILVGEFLGERKLANLGKLLDLAYSFDRAGFLTLDDYLYQLANFVAKQPKEPPAATQPEASDVVRLMSIHQAKGLEFPVVIVPDLNRRMQVPSSSTAYHPQLGPLVRLPSELREEPSVSGLTLYDAIEQEDDEEELIRLLYVATTRAADVLVLSASWAPEQTLANPWTKLLAERFDLESGRPLGTGGDNVRVRVLNEEPRLSRAAERRPKAVDRAKIASQAEHARTGEVPPLVARIRPQPAGRRQYSVSRMEGTLKLAIPQAERLDRLPTAHAAEEPLARAQALQLGTLIHGVLAEMGSQPPDDLERMIERTARQMIVPGTPWPDLQEVAKILRGFLQTARARSLFAAPHVETELEFLLSWPPDQPPEPDDLFLLGNIDVIYQDAAGDWHLVDYKTHDVQPANRAALKSQFEMQVHLYALAVEKVLGRAPVEVCIHWLRTGDEDHWTWNATARKHGLRLVSEALRTIRTASVD